MGKIPRQGEYLTSADAKNGDVVEILKAPELRSKEETGFERDVWSITVLLPNKTTKQWTLNKTTYNDCWDVFGDESEHWVGRRLRINTETRKIRGEKKTIVYGEPIEEAITEQVSLENLTEEQKEKLRQELNQVTEKNLES